MADEPQQPDQPNQPDNESEKIYSKSDLDRIVQDRLARDRQKYSDYEDLRKQVDEFNKQKDQINQQDLERKQEYDKIKKGWEDKETQYKTQIDQVRSELYGERINNALAGEIMKRNAYGDAVQLIKPMAKYNDDGTITIRGKDANGIETDLPVDKGVEQFLKDRPYFVKGSGQGGGGTGSGTGAGHGGEEANLSKQLQDAMAVGDRQKVNDLKKQIREKHLKQSGFTLAQ